MSHRIAVHPGAILKDELEERGISQSALAVHIGVLPRSINEVCRGKRGISAELAVKLSMALGASPAFWINLQKNWELSRVKLRGAKKLSRSRRRSLFALAKCQCRPHTTAARRSTAAMVCLTYSPPKSMT